MRSIARPLAVLITIGAGGAVPAAAQPSYTLVGSDVAVYNLAGTITVTGGAGSGVEVHVAARGRDAGQLRIEHGRLGSRDALRVFAPVDRIIYSDLGRTSTSSLRVSADGTFLDGGVGAALMRSGVTIAGSGRGVQAWADVTVAVPRGRSVHLHLGAGTIEVDNVEGTIYTRTGAGRTRLSDVTGDVDVQTSSGGATLVNVAGNVAVRSTSGAVRIDGVQGVRHTVATSSGGVAARRVAADQVNLSASSGNIVMRQLEATRAELRTSSGSILLEDALGVRLSARASSGRVRMLDVAFDDVELRASSGSVELVARSAVHNVAITTTSGSVRTAVPADFSGEVDVRTGSGGIRVDVPVDDLVSGRSRLTGRIGAGGGALRIRTGSGGVRIVRG
jgi:DUF4097 and DUF4098 domain-containing protein YvlB